MVRACLLRAGYGMTTPHTLSGKMTVIVYGLLGCSGCILFFNLFLERIVTVHGYNHTFLQVFHITI